MIPEAVILTGEDLAHALRGAVWRRVDRMPDDLCPGWGDRHEALWDRLEEQEWGKDESVVYIFDGILWRCREKGGVWDELDEEPPEYVAEYAVPAASFLARLKQRELEARGQLRLPILKDGVHEQAR